MGCFIHEHSHATAVCQGCGRGTCTECSNRFGDPWCEQCLLRHNTGVARQMYAGLVTTLAIFVLSTWFFVRLEDSSGHPAVPFASAALIGALFAFTYWGWKFLSNYFPTLWFGTGIIWLIYAIAKFIASYFIGLIVGPFQIIRMLNQIRIVNRVKHQIASGQL